MANLTDAEIIKCAEECIGDIPPCGVCPFDEDAIATSECMGEVIKNLLSIINRLQDEREALINGQETLQKTIVEQKAEIERLKKGRLINADELFAKFAGHSDYHGDTILCVIEAMSEGKFVDVARPLDTDKIKTEAIKEFWDRLKKEKVTHKNLGEMVYVEDGDNLVKELTERKE